MKLDNIFSLAYCIRFCIHFYWSLSQFDNKYLKVDNKNYKNFTFFCSLQFPYADISPELSSIKVN